MAWITQEVPFEIHPDVDTQLHQWVLVWSEDEDVRYRVDFRTVSGRTGVEVERWVPSMTLWEIARYWPPSLIPSLFRIFQELEGACVDLSSVFTEKSVQGEPNEDDDRSEVEREVSFDQLEALVWVNVGFEQGIGTYSDGERWIAFNDPEWTEEGYRTATQHTEWLQRDEQDFWLAALREGFMFEDIQDMILRVLNDYRSNRPGHERVLRLWAQLPASEGQREDIQLLGRMEVVIARIQRAREEGWPYLSEVVSDCEQALTDLEEALEPEDN